MQALVQAWTMPATAWHGTGWRPNGTGISPPWPPSLAEFVRASQRAGLDPVVVEALLDRCHAAREAADKALVPQAPSVRKETFGQRLEALGKLAAAFGLSAQSTRHLVALARHVQAQPGLYPLRDLSPLLRGLPSGAAALPEVQALRAGVVEALRQALALPQPAADDHGLGDIEWTCRCKDCRPVIDWAASPTPRPLTLPMAEARRNHVQA